MIGMFKYHLSIKQLKQFFDAVDKKGRVTFNRPIPANAVNPIVEVNLEDNKLSAYRDNYTQGYHHGGEYVKNVVLALEKQHHYKQINLVGHSMGNLEIINYINDNVNDKSLPQVAHLVAIARYRTSSLQ